MRVHEMVWYVGGLVLVVCGTVVVIAFSEIWHELHRDDHG